jgi:hypothetical protein
VITLHEFNNGRAVISLDIHDTEITAEVLTEFESHSGCRSPALHCVVEGTTKKYHMGRRTLVSMGSLRRPAQVDTEAGS